MPVVKSPKDKEQKPLNKAIKEAGNIYEYKKALARFVRQYRSPRMRDPDYQVPRPDLLAAFRDGRNDMAELVLMHLEIKEK